MKAKRILAIDYGSKRIGLALSDPLGMIAYPLPFLPNRGESKLILELKKIVIEKSVELILFGLPRSLDDSIGAQAREYIKCSEKIQKALAIEIKLVDERFSSRESEAFLIEELDISREKRKKMRDSLSACLLLKSYLAAQEKF
ncbi:MAG: Holliday junction resolvase RuvX [Elusimicrobia bacterium]|nr:Holliday junction resolvase RuvX [Elusimicrobiota bacterium]